MVKRNLTKDPPRLYSAGQEVLVKLQSKKWNKVKGKGVSVPPSSLGKVVDVRPATNKYKVQVYVDGTCMEEWVSVSKITSLTRAEEKLRETNGKLHILIDNF